MLLTIICNFFFLQHTPCGLHLQLFAFDVDIYVFASAHAVRIASCDYQEVGKPDRPLPQHTPCGLHQTYQDYIAVAEDLCLSTRRADCIERQPYFRGLLRALPQHTPCGLHHGQGCDRGRRICLCLSTRRADCIRTDNHTIPKRGFFASAHAVRIASIYAVDTLCLRGLCLSTRRADCI